MNHTVVIFSIGWIVSVEFVLWFVRVFTAINMPEAGQHFVMLTRHILARLNLTERALKTRIYT